jgi:hypothetical protein
MIYDPANVNVAITEDGTLMRRVITYDMGKPGADPAEQFVPMPENTDFRRPEW